MADDHSERITILEVKHDEREKDIEELLLRLQKHMEEEEKRWETIVTRIDTIEKTFTKYSGFVGGILFVGAGVWALINFATRFWNG